MVSSTRLGIGKGSVEEGTGRGRAPVVGARVTEGDGCSPSGGGGGGEEGEEVREAAGGGGGGRGAGRGLRLGGEGEDERRQGEERAAGAAETDEGGSHG